jgi:hypothetical protein
MTWVGFEPTVPASERAKTVHSLDRSATVTGQYLTYGPEITYEVFRLYGGNTLKKEAVSTFDLLVTSSKIMRYH